MNAGRLPDFNNMRLDLRRGGLGRLLGPYQDLPVTELAAFRGLPIPRPHGNIRNVLARVRQDSHGAASFAPRSLKLARASPKPPRRVKYGSIGLKLLVL